MGKLGRFDELCEELVALLHDQLAVIKERGIENFPAAEMEEFLRRKARVAELRAAIEKLIAASNN